MKKIVKESELDVSKDYLALWNRWTLDSPGVRESIVDCTVWSLVTWDGETKSFIIDDGSDHGLGPLRFNMFKAIYQLPQTHTEFDVEDLK